MLVIITSWELWGREDCNEPSLPKDTDVVFIFQQLANVVLKSHIENYVKNNSFKKKKK